MSDFHILLVEDEPGLIKTLTDRLQRDSFIVTSATDAPTAELLLRQQKFDLVLLDIMLPGGSGFDICTGMRRTDPVTPILMLTARDSVADRVRGLKLGADDYLTKPFEMSELLARINALLRRGPGLSPELTIGRATVDFDAGTVLIDGSAIDVSAQSLKLLKYLVQHSGRTITREELLSRVWGHKQAPSSRTVDVHVAWLRRAVEDNPRDPRHIITVHATGYRFDP